MTTKLYALTDEQVEKLRFLTAPYDMGLSKPVDVHTVDIRGGGYAKYIKEQAAQITALREQLTRRDEQIAAMVEVERLRRVWIDAAEKLNFYSASHMGRIPQNLVDNYDNSKKAYEAARDSTFKGVL